MYRIIALMITVAAMLFTTPNHTSAVVVVEVSEPMPSTTCCPRTILVEAEASCASTVRRDLVTELVRDGRVVMRWSRKGRCTISTSRTVGCPGSGYYQVVSYLKNPQRSQIYGSDASRRRYIYC